MLGRMFVRLAVVGVLALVAGPVSAQTQPGVAFERTFGTGWLSVMAAHPDGGFLIAGRRFAEAGEQHPLVIRIGPDGRVLWEKAFPNRRRGEAQGVQVVPGVGARVTGYAGPFYGPTIRRLDWIAEIDDEGRATRDDSFDLDRPLHAGRFVPITPSTFAFYGSTNGDTGIQGVDIFATDAKGSLLWRANMPDVFGECEGVVTGDPDGNLVAVFGTALPDMSPDGARFRRFDARGQLTRDQPFSAFKDACPLAIRSAPDGGFVVTGARSQADGPTGWVARLDATGSVVWESLFGPAEKAVTAGYDATVTPDGGLVVAGCIAAFAPEGLVLRYGPGGDLAGERRFPSQYGVNPVTVHVAADGSITLAGVLDQSCGWISGKTSGGGAAWATALTPGGLQAPAR